MSLLFGGPANMDSGDLQKILRIEKGFRNQIDLEVASEKVAEDCGISTYKILQSSVSDLQRRDDDKRQLKPYDMSAGRFMTMLTLYDMTPLDFSLRTGYRFPGRFGHETEAGLKTKTDAVEVPNINNNKKDVVKVPFEWIRSNNRNFGQTRFVNVIEVAIDGSCIQALQGYSHLLVDKSFENAPVKLVELGKRFQVTRDNLPDSKFIAGVFYGLTSGLIE